MVNKIYTKTGDAGETGLFAGGRVPKDDERVEAYGCVDELNALIGVTRTLLNEAKLDAALHRLEGELFCLGADLATPLEATTSWVVRIDEEMVTRLEHEIDAFELELAPLQHFILPGGCPAGAYLHLARTVCRRAERRTITLSHTTELNGAALRYLNRLSDWLFTAARLANRRAGTPEEPWISPAERSRDA